MIFGKTSAERRKNHEDYMSWWRGPREAITILPRVCTSCGRWVLWEIVEITKEAKYHYNMVDGTSFFTDTKRRCRECVSAGR